MTVDHARTHAMGGEIVRLIVYPGGACVLAHSCFWRWRCALCYRQRRPMYSPAHIRNRGSRHPSGRAYDGYLFQMRRPPGLRQRRSSQT